MTTTSSERIGHVTCTHGSPDACAMLVTARDGRVVDALVETTHRDPA